MVQHLRTCNFGIKCCQGLTILDFDSKAARQASEIVKQLKTKRKSIDKPDLFIAATAVVHGLALDTTNTKHFIYIEGLKLLGL